MPVIGLILSLAIGLTLGLLGGGGSILTVPVIHYVFGVGAHDAVAMSLVVVGTTSSIALISHARAGSVKWRVGLVFGSSSMVAAFAGGMLGAALPATAVITAFAVLMLVAGTVMLLRSRRPIVPRGGRVSSTRLLAIGLGVGLLTGTLGAGGGFVIVPVLTMLGGLAMREAIATSLLVIALNSIAGLAGTMGHASFDPAIAGAVTAVAVTGSFIGARIGKQLSATHLQRAFGSLVVVVGIVVLIQEIC